MPGITGIIGGGSPAERNATVESMVEVMRREAFYELGSFGHERCGVAAGWAVHRGSFSDANPVWNESRDVCLIFTGEEFSDDAVIAALRARGHTFNADDASWLVHAYEEEGAAFVEKLNGTFAGLVVDLRQDRVILFNDRFGLGRIYLHEQADGLCFSSEAKSLLRVLPGVRQIDPVGLAEFASAGCAMQQRTLFAGVSLLPPASRWVFSRGQLERKETYFTPETWENLPHLAEGEFYEQLKATFTKIVPRYFRGRSRVGVSLTGGLDGRMIMACSGQEPGTLPCYTFGGTYRDCTDVVFARQVAKVCGQPHQVIPVDDAFIRQFGPLAEKSVYVSDGAMDVTGAVELFANRLAREIAPVRMTGNYGSEILRSNVAFKAQPLSGELFSPEFLRLGEAAVATYQHAARGNRLSLISFKQVPWHHHSRLSVEQSQLTMRSPYLDNELVALAYQAPVGQEFSKTPALRFIAEGNEALGRIPTDRGLVYRATPVLTKLHNFYQEFTFKAEYAYDYGMPQWLARADHALAPLHLEKLFLGRHKFYHFRVWYRDQLGAYLKEVLLDAKTRSRPHLQGARLERLVNEHVSGQRNHTTELHQALSLELIYRQLIERSW
jgi:asparagine synthase (glutamine-hydrolysing)